MPLLLVAGLLLASARATAQNTIVTRGKYLAIVGDCTSCHLKDYGGGRALSSLLGTVYATNITSDKDTGIGNWTAGQFYRAMHSGIRADGAHLYPAFPFAYFTLMPRSDTDALFAYLKSLRPVRRVTPRNRVWFPFNMRWTLAIWNRLNFHKRTFRPDPRRTAQWNLGAYLVDGPAHCADCHTPKTFLLGEKSSNAFAGEVIENWFAPNLTGNEREGLGLWSAAEIAEFLKTGRTGRARVLGTMTEVVADSTSKMTNTDRAGIAEYLKSVPSSRPKEPYDVEPAAMARGGVVFTQTCVLCHAERGDDRRIGPFFGGDTVINSRDPTTVLRVILEGAQAYAPKGEEPAYSMPAFAWLSDGQVADVATYIRNSWGNKAEPVSRRQVHSLRERLYGKN